MTPADVARLIRVLRAVQKDFYGSNDRYRSGIYAGLMIAINAIDAESEDAA